MIWAAEHVEALEQAASAAGQRVAVHLEIDTGMGRQGAAAPEAHVSAPELRRMLERLATSPWVWCEGLMTHLCCAEAAGEGMTTAQRRRFAAAIDEVTGAGIRPEFLHMANTSGVDEGSTMQWVRDVALQIGARAMVRTGLAIYGYALPLEGYALPLEGGGGNTATHTATLRPRLKPVMVWKTRVIGVRDLEPGASVGYGATFTAARPMRLALLPVGYADGFRREASSGVGNGWVMIAGKRAPVVGRVSMNLTTVDVTEMTGVDAGTEVVLLGEGVTAEDHARWCGTIPYEIMCGVRARFELC